MEFRILGPIEVIDDGRVVPLNAAKPRAVLAMLLLRANELVPSSRLIDDLWDDAPPATAVKVLQTYVSQLRRLLGPDVISTAPGGYRLRVEPECVDLLRFRRLSGGDTGGTPADVASRLREALSLWRGEPLAEFSDQRWARTESERLDELRLGALERRIDADLAAGRDRELVDELERLVAAHPLREHLRAQLMLALYRSGRQGDALAAYREARRLLVETLGIEPTLALRQLERSILDQDPALDLPLPPVASPVVGDPSMEIRASSFVGRARELREIRELLSRKDVRLLTLTGPGGSGKTRLAREATADLPTVLVELAPIADAALVARAIADALGVQERLEHTAREVLLEYLRDRQALVLLDNLEHVLDATPLLRELLAGALGVTLLVTSRAPLGVPEERVYRVPALELPDGSHRSSLRALAEIESIRLFVDRAREVRPDFELSETNAEALIELCVRLDGLPLALELAAARCELLSIQALLERLGSRLDLLRATPGSGLAERQWTLRGAIDWSYDLLDQDLQRLFTSLGVFVGGFTLAAAQHVAEQPDLDSLEGVEALLRNNLLTTEPAPGDEPRLGMLETIREFALERLAARGDSEVVRRRHAAFYLLLAEEAEPGLLGPQQRQWLERLDPERDNIRAVLAWAQTAGEAETGLRIATALWRFWQLRNHELEARENLEQLLALGAGSPSTRARAQTIVGSMSFVLGDFETARRVLVEGLPVHRECGDVRMTASTLGLLAVTDGDPDSALALSRESLDVARNGNDAYVEGHALWHVGISLARVGELDGAERAVEDAVGFARAHGNLRSVGSWQKTLAGLAIIRGDRARALRLFEESLAIHRDLDDAWGVSHCLSNLSFLALEAGDAETARTLLAEALAIERDSGHQPRLANALEMSARLAVSDGKPALATRLYACAERLGERVRGLTFEVGWPDPRPDLDELRSQIGDGRFEEEWTRGRAMSISEAIDQALGEQVLPEPRIP